MNTDLPEIGSYWSNISLWDVMCLIVPEFIIHVSQNLCLSYAIVAASLNNISPSPEILATFLEIPYRYSYTISRSVIYRHIKSGKYFSSYFSNLIYHICCSHWNHGSSILLLSSLKLLLVSNLPTCLSYSCAGFFFENSSYEIVEI